MDELHDGRRLPTDELPKCPRCDGTGEAPCSSCLGNGIKLGFGNTILDCPKCEGFGGVECPDCHGTGYHEETDEVRDDHNLHSR